MTDLDIFSHLNFGRFGATQGDIDVVSGNLVLAFPANGKPHYHAKSVRVRAGANLFLTENITSGVYYSAELWVDGPVLVEGTIFVTFAAPAPGPVAPINWDGATAGGDGGTTPTGGTAGGATAGIPTLHDILFNGQYNGTPTDYRYFHIMRNWYYAGGGGRGWRTATGTASVLGGLPGGAAVIIARGKITVASGGIIDASGQNGSNGTVSLAGAAGGGGGGAGGLIGLISWTEIEVASGGLVDCTGGNGGNGAVAGLGGSGGRTGGGGGGGGGGFVFAIAPRMDIALLGYQILPGAAGTTAVGGGSLNAYGGGGGGSFGAGGAGQAGGVAGRAVQFPTSSGSSQRGQSQWIDV